MTVAATVAGISVEVGEVDAREAVLRASPQVSALPRPHTSEGRQLRRWLTQLLVAEKLVAREADRLGATVTDATPGVDELLPDSTARLEIGSIAAAVLADPIARAVFAQVTGDVAVADDSVADFYARNPRRFPRFTANSGWQVACEPDLAAVRPLIAAHLLGAARRRRFRMWLDQRRADLVWLAPGYEHPGDPRQPDNTHKH
ncbi:malonyl CoA-ACP transacylase [Mycobacterium sp. CVI_P3]|uniref:Malonyl CoA-ACP transacylase n=1 Tax=Mycobacterium pinniadriaticum TaxID=2994102 RepID=A0ABT3SND1_9MYCO|nr:malonyl CoA-ACP transacylase [Mycobacterium pinniadriaticum]MCX2934619.1 malonyl CoA-ACP transacylase [Mycobacterium pinniadriaticum]MCX2941042.1 malonyl CoA-ACP transacylase [Mycobacterium pinniadriaticum]